MAKNTIADFSVTPASNTDVLGEAVSNANTGDKLDDMIRDVMAVLARFYGDLGGTGMVGGTGDAITLTSTSTYQALEDGLIAAFKASADNTGATTFNLDSLGTKAVRGKGDVALSGGEIIEDGFYLLRYDTALNSSAGGWMLLNPEPLETLGQHTIYVPAGAMTPATTNGAASGSTETTTNKVMVSTLDFDASTEEFAQFGVQMPKSWDGGTLVAQFIWTHGSTTTNFGVTWGIEAVALADGDAADTAWGTEVDTADTGGTAGDIYISPESAAVTAGNTPAGQKLVKFRVTRVVADSGDTLAVDAKLLGVEILYTTNASTDD